MKRSFTGNTLQSVKKGFEAGVGTEGGEDLAFAPFSYVIDQLSLQKPFSCIKGVTVQKRGCICIFTAIVTVDKIIFLCVIKSFFKIQNCIFKISVFHSDFGFSEIYMAHFMMKSTVVSV